MKLWELKAKFGGCGFCHHRYQCEKCQKFLCDSPAHLVRLTKTGREAANSPRKLCVGCGIAEREKPRPASKEKNDG